METRNYLIETFGYNSYANKMVLQKIALLPDQHTCIRLFSHLINCQYKWLDRLQCYPGVSSLDWWTPVYALHDLEKEWNRSTENWIQFLQTKTEAELDAYVQWIGIGNATYTAQLKDIPLQLNYHSIHHRAQMQTIIRQQGLEPDFVDYIGTKYKKVEE